MHACTQEKNKYWVNELLSVCLSILVSGVCGQIKRLSIAKGRERLSWYLRIFLLVFLPSALSISLHKGRSVVSKIIGLFNLFYNVSVIACRVRSVVFNKMSLKCYTASSWKRTQFTGYWQLRRSRMWSLTTWRWHMYAFEAHIFYLSRNWTAVVSEKTCLKKRNVAKLLRLEAFSSFWRSISILIGRFYLRRYDERSRDYQGCCCDIFARF